MPTIYGAIDLSKNELRNAVVQNLPSAPSSPVKGQVYYDTVGNILYWYNGSGWVAAQGGAGAVPATTVTTEAVGDAPVVGVATTYAREDHKHGREAFGAITAQTAFGAASSNGAAATVTRSDHAHGTPVHDAAAHSTIPLNALATPTGDINMGGTWSIRGIPVAPPGGDYVVSKQYVDNVLAGLQWKQPCRIGTTANVGLTGLAAIDGVTPIANDRILVKNQTTTTANGIYTAAVGAWTRATDADVSSELASASVYISEGTTNADTAWTCTNDRSMIIGTDPITFVQFAGSGAVTAGAGMTQVGNTLNVITGDTSLVVNPDELHVNTAVMATVASLAGYVPTTRSVIAGAGLTGGGTLAADATLNVIAGDTSLTVAADSVVVNTGVIATVASVAAKATKFAAALTGTASPEVITHNLNTRDVQVTILNGASPYTAVEVDWDATTVNTVTIRYTPNLGAGYRAVVVG